MIQWGWKAPSNHSSTTDLSFKTEAQNEAIRKPIRKNLPPVLGGMDKAEALACVSRLFDAAEAGAVLWGDALLVRQNNRRILEQLLLASSSSTG